MYGDVTFKVAEEMRKPEVLDFFARLIQRTSPKSYAQARGEVVVTTRFLENFCGDQVLQRAYIQIRIACQHDLRQHLSGKITARIWPGQCTGDQRQDQPAPSLSRTPPQA